MKIDAVIDALEINPKDELLPETYISPTPKPKSLRIVLGKTLLQMLHWISEILLLHAVFNIPGFWRPPM